MGQAIHSFAISKACEESSGFAGDTLIKTAVSYEEIRHLKPGSQVITLVEKTGDLCERSVTAVTTALTTKVFCLTFGDRERTAIYAGTKQTFYSDNPLAEMFNLKKYSLVLLLGVLGAGYAQTNQPAQPEAPTPPPAAQSAANAMSDPSKPIVVQSSAPEFTIHLASNPTTGYSWFLKKYNMPEYTALFYFENKVLVKYDFGFVYP